MELDPVRVEDTQAWLVKSRKDLARAARYLAAETQDLEEALFHSQQAVEKALKAILTWHDEPFRKTHDLEALARQCAHMDSTMALFVGWSG